MTDRKDTPALAAGYVAANTTQFSAALFLLERLPLAPGARVLDVGCGPGNLSAHVAGLVAPAGRVVGLDPSAERIRLAQDLRVANAVFEVGVAEDLSRFEDGQFDVVFVNSTLHWVSDQPRAIREFARVLKTGGRLGVSGGSGDFEAAHERIKAAVLARPPFSQYEEVGGPRFLKHAEMDALLDAAGFGARSIVVNTIVKATQNPDEMIDWLDASSSGQTYGGIPLDMRPAARAEMKALWEREVRPEGGIRMDMELLVTVATKT